MDKRNEKTPKPQCAWAYYNMGTLVGIARTRSGAIAEVEDSTDESWERSRNYFSVRKVIVEPINE